MGLDFSPFATGGAAARADSFTRLDPKFATGVHGLTSAARAAGIPLQITSAYRSPPVQAQIVADGMAKYGLGNRADAWRADVARLGPEAAGRQWRPEMREAGLTRFIAMPGGSQHQRGTAVDFAMNGSLIRDANSPAAQFIRNNAEQYGLSVPMSWEPWQVEPVGSRVRKSTKGAPQMAMQPTQPQGLLGQFGIQRQDPTAQGETALPFYQRGKFNNTMGNLAMAFNSLRQRPDENIPRIVAGNRATREQAGMQTRTVEWLRSQPGGERFAEMAEAMGPQSALQAYQQSRAQPDQTSGMQNYQFLVSQGVDPAEALARAFGKGGVTVNTGTQESAFQKKTGEFQAQETSEIVAAGAAAQRASGQLDVLEEALRDSPSGAQAVFVNSAGRLGIELEGATNLQVAEAIISQLVPAQRPPGSGVMSDADLALFKRSLPELINTREGNQQIINTMRAVGQYDMARGQIARQLQQGKLDFTEAAEAYIALGNPLQRYRDIAAQAAQAQALTQSASNAGVTQTLWDNMTPEERSAF